MLKCLKRYGILLIIIVIVYLVSVYFRNFGPLSRVDSIIGLQSPLVLDTSIHIYPGFTKRELIVLDPDNRDFRLWATIDPHISDLVLYSQQQKFLYVNPTRKESIYEITYDGEISEVEGKEFCFEELSRNGCVHGFSFSPNGNQIAYVTNWVGSENHKLIIQKIDGTDSKVVWESDHLLGIPSWSPDGSRLVFSDSSGMSSELYIFDIENNQIIQIPDFQGERIYHPEWSPDGGRIAFVRFSLKDATSLWLVDADGNNPMQIFHPSSNYDSITRIIDIAWSPDGSQLAFASNHEGYCGILVASVESKSCTESIYVIDEDGTGLTRLTNRWLHGTRLFWLPN